MRLPPHPAVSWIPFLGLLGLAAPAAPAAEEEPPPRFLAEPPPQPVHYHHNRITLTTDTLETGWAKLYQCHTNMDNLGATQIVFTAGRIRGLTVVHAQNIEQARVEGPSVQLDGVKEGAEVCIRGETRLLEHQGEQVVVRNGPFMRRLFDSYFPMHVTLEIHFPADHLSYLGVSPSPQPGLSVTPHPGRVEVDAWFEGVLSTEIRFRPSGS